MTMKHVKRLASLLLALTLVFALAATASAADTTISAPADSTRTYDVYQIFTGDLSEDVLSNVKWGKNGTETEGTVVSQETLDALTAVNSKSNTEKLAEIQRYVNLDSTAMGTVAKDTPLSVPTGYYLIKDNGPVGDGEAYSLYVVQIVGDTTISPKVGTITSDKKVDDKNDSTGAEDSVSWQDSADYDIGDAVPFKLSATIAEDYANYAHGYKLTFHDTEESGLTFNPDSVKVYVDGTQIDNGYQVVTEDLTDGCTFEVKFTNLKDITSVNAGSVISVEYTSTLNETAKIGAAGNKNTSHVTYTNNPNDDQAGENGKTPNDTVIVFTYKTVINKVKADNAPLTGAAFKLEKKGTGDTWTVVKEFTVSENAPASMFEFTGLDDGTYKLTETVTPAGYNSIDPIEFTITAEHDVLSDNPALTSLSGNAATGEITFTPSVSDGSLSTDIVNQSGSTLPETGGVGTTLFYVLGGILVAGAVVLLVTKKRMNSAE